MTLGPLNFRKASLEDAEMLLNWRNDPQTRAHSHNKDIIALPEHLAWLRKMLDLPNHHLFVVNCLDLAIGSCRAEWRTNYWLLSWTVAPQARGQGLGKAMVSQLVANFRPCRAEVYGENIASRQIALAAGMQLLEENVNFSLFYKD